MAKISKGVSDAMYTSVENELAQIRKNYRFPNNVLKRITGYYKLYPAKIGTVTRTIDYLMELFSDYGLTPEEAIQQITYYPDIIFASKLEMERKLTVLNTVGLAEPVLFTAPQKLCNNSKLSSLDLYACIKNLKINDIDPDMKAIFASENLAPYQLEELKEVFPLNVSKYVLLNIAFDLSRRAKKEELINQNDGENKKPIGLKLTRNSITESQNEEK